VVRLELHGEKRQLEESVEPVAATSSSSDSDATEDPVED